jgi:hypothetical protein
MQMTTSPRIIGIHAHAGCAKKDIMRDIIATMIATIWIMMSPP